MQDTQDKELSFVIPTHRLREVGATIEEYDEHFWRNGHSVRLIVFDDSSPVNQQKYYPLLEQTRTHQPVYYVGPAEKEQFLAYLNSRLRDRRLQMLVRNLFRPSYGGNRNCTLMYTLGGPMISSDDDMRPYSFVEYSPESLAEDQVENGYTRSIGRSDCLVRPAPTGLKALIFGRYRESVNTEIASKTKLKLFGELTQVGEIVGRTRHTALANSFNQSHPESVTTIGCLEAH